MNLKNFADVENVPIGFTWRSKKNRVNLLQFLGFASSTGDWNPIHINPLTAWRYRSNLGGLTCCGDLASGVTIPGIHKIFRFKEPTEVIAIGSQTKFISPLHPGDPYEYIYTLKERVIKGNRAYCAWEIEMKTLEPEAKLILRETWKMLYAPVERRRFVAPIRNALWSGWMDFKAQPVPILGLLAFVVMMTGCIMSYQPPFPNCDFCFPIAP